MKIKPLAEHFYDCIRAQHGQDMEALKMGAAMTALYSQSLGGSPEGLELFSKMVMENIDENKLMEVVFNTEKKQ